MVEKPTGDDTIPLTVAALKQALTQTQEQPLFRVGKAAGLFPSRTGLSGRAAQEAVQQGWLEVVRLEKTAKGDLPWVRITPRGVEFLYQHESPKAVLEELRDLLRCSREGLPRFAQEVQAQLQALLNRMQALLERQEQMLGQLRDRVEAALARLEGAADGAASAPWHRDALAYLDRRRIAGADGPCPLAELFHALRRQHCDLELPDFHAGLLQLRQRDTIRLVAWPSPGEPLGEPEYALLDDSEVYYAVQRC